MRFMLIESFCILLAIVVANEVFISFKIKRIIIDTVLLTNNAKRIFLYKHVSDQRKQKSFGLIAIRLVKAMMCLVIGLLLFSAPFVILIFLDFYFALDAIEFLISLEGMLLSVILFVTVSFLRSKISYE
jgi:hypothetical protein